MYSLPFYIRNNKNASASPESKGHRDVPPLRQKLKPSQEAGNYSCFLNCSLGTLQEKSINEATINISHNTLHIYIHEVTIRTLCVC